MYVFVGKIRPYNSGEHLYSVLDTKDLVCEDVSVSDLINLYNEVPNLSISGVSYDKERNIIGSKSGNIGVVVEDDYALLHIKKSNYYDIILYKRGVDAMVWQCSTPESAIDYVNFSLETISDKYLAINVSVTDKHYYAEDREEYFGLYYILDTSVIPAKALRQDTFYTFADSLEWYRYDKDTGMLDPKFSM